MAVVQELIARLRFQVDQPGVNKVDNQLDGLAKKAAGLAAAYVSVGKAVGVVVDSVKAAANLESLNAEFEVMLGNADAAKYLVQQINQFAAETPFETTGLVANVRLMMAFGQSANDALAATKMLGDVAGSDQERLNRLALAYAQVMAAGKMQGQDLLQFVNAGFNPLQELSQKTGKSVGTLRKEMEKGLISAQMVKEAFASATGPGGRFFGNMEKQSKTLTGLWSTLRDNFHMMMAELGGQLVPFVKKVVVVLIELTESIGDAYRKLGDFFSLMFSDGPTAGDVAAYIAAGFETIADVIMLVGTAMQLFKYLFIRAANEIAAESWNLVDAILWIPKKFLEMLMSITDAAYEFQGWVKGGNTTKDAQRYSATRGKLGGWYETIGGKEGFEPAMRATGAAENQAEWDKFIELGQMIGQSKPRDDSARAKLSEDILKRLEGKSQKVDINTNVTVYAEGSMKDILTEQANSIFGNVIGVQLRAASV